jgi:hypothetical protein
MPIREDDIVNQKSMDTAMEFNDGFRVIYPDIDYDGDVRSYRRRELRFRRL